MLHKSLNNYGYIFPWWQAYFPEHSFRDHLAHVHFHSISPVWHVCTSKPKLFRTSTSSSCCTQSRPCPSRGRLTRYRLWRRYLPYRMAYNTELTVHLFTFSNRFLFCLFWFLRNSDEDHDQDPFWSVNSLFWIQKKIKIQSNMFKAPFFINYNTETFFLTIFPPSN